MSTLKPDSSLDAVAAATKALHAKMDDCYNSAKAFKYLKKLSGTVAFFYCAFQAKSQFPDERIPLKTENNIMAGIYYINTGHLL